MGVPQVKRKGEAGERGRFIRRILPSSDRALIGLRDIAVLGWFLTSIPVVAVTSPSFWSRYARWIAGAVCRILPPRKLTEQVMQQGGYDLSRAREITERSMALRLESNLHTFGGFLFGSKFDVQVSGVENLAQALDGGRGAVLWIADQVFAGDAVKVGLGTAGYEVSHMSRPEHGFSGTRFGIRFLNPIRTRFEMRYLKERVVFDRDKPATTMRTLRKRLTGNAVVSFLASAYEGRSLIEQPFLSGSTSLATGAPRLAQSAGASLLPVFVRRTDTPGRLEVVIEAPIRLVPGEKADEGVMAATRQYMTQLERYVRDDPALWRSWGQAAATDNGAARAEP